MDAWLISRKLEEAYRLCYSNSIYAPGRTDYYDFVVNPETDDGRRYILAITFKNGESYCCAEPGCHFGFWTAADWARLRSKLRSVGLEFLGPLSITKVHVMVEPGAVLGLRFPGDTSSPNLRALHKGFSYSIGPFDESDPRLCDNMRLA